MEIKTCEQYVLAQLFDQQDENDMLNRELKYRDERIDELTGQIDAIEAAHGSAMQQAIRKAGRDAQQRARRQQRPARAVQKPRRAHGAGQQRAKRQRAARPDRSVSFHVLLPSPI